MADSTDVAGSNVPASSTVLTDDEKKAKTKKIILYVAIAAVALFLVYHFFIKNR
jgi:hypothetical protein